jgi:hypothetical protein
MLQEAEDLDAVIHEKEDKDKKSVPDKGGKFICDVESVQFANHEDYYAMLGISHLSMIATHEQIRRACKKYFIFEELNFLL